MDFPPLKCNCFCLHVDAVRMLGGLEECAVLVLRRHKALWRTCWVTYSPWAVLCSSYPSLIHHVHMFGCYKCMFLSLRSLCSVLRKFLPQSCSWCKLTESYVHNWPKVSFGVPCLLNGKGVDWNRNFEHFTFHPSIPRGAEHKWFCTTAALPAGVVMLFLLARQPQELLYSIFYLQPVLPCSWVTWAAYQAADRYQICSWALLHIQAAKLTDQTSCLGQFCFSTWRILEFWPLSNSVKHLQCWQVPLPAAHPLELPGSSPFLRAVFLQAALCPWTSYCHLGATLLIPLMYLDWRWSQY